MQYDDIILQCLGDCDACSVYLECQYQTSFGEEKDKYLKLLTERDEKAEKEKQLEPEALGESSAENTANATTEEAPLNEVFEEPAPIEDLSLLEEAEVSKCDCEAEVCTEESLEEIVFSPVTAVSEEKIKAIYDEVFNLNDFTLRTTDVEAKKAVTENVAVAEEAVKITHADATAQPITPISEEAVRKIYEEVFNLEPVKACEETIDEKPSCLASADESAEVKTPETVSEATPEVTAEAVCEKPSSITPANEDTVKAIYAEVFGFDLAPSAVDEEEKVEKNQEKPVEAEEAKQPAAATAEEVKENIEKVEEVKEDAEVSEAEKATSAPVKETFKLTPPENNERLMADMCAKRGRKLIYKPSEALITATFKVIGTDKKNDIGEKVKDILDAEIKQGVKIGYLDKFDGLNSSEIKEEYENDIVYEFADQEFKKTGVIYDGKKIKVYIYDWDGKACHHIGYVDVNDAAELIPYFVDKDKYSFDVCGIITGGKGKRVVKEGNTLKIVKEKGDPIGVDVDIAVLNRKD